MNNHISFFLIGGSGFIGSSFSKYLKQKNIIARNILRNEISDSKSLNFDERILDRLPVSSIKNIIIDFAYTSIPNTSFSDPVKDFTENLYNINCHLAFAEKLPNTSYIHVSSGGTVYGNVNDYVPIKENAPNVPLSPYGITKLASEKYALMHKEIYGLDVKIVRPANIYGPGQKPFRGQGFISTAIAKIIMDEPIQIFGDGSVIRDYLYIDDFCEALYTIIEKGTTGEIYNIGSGVGHSTKHVLETIKSVIKTDGKSFNEEYLPSRPFDVTYNVLDCLKLNELNDDFQKISIEEGIRASYLWLQKYLE